jgi:hypothetical protein
MKRKKDIQGQASITKFAKPLESKATADEDVSESAAKKSKTSSDNSSSSSSSQNKEQALKTGTEADFAFKPEWVQKYPCIYKVELPLEKRGLYCKVCQKARKGGKWDNEPYRAVREDRITGHLTSEAHIDSVRLTHTQPSLAFAQELNTDEDFFQAWRAKFECIYWLATEEVCVILPRILIPCLCRLQMSSLYLWNNWLSDLECA